MTQAPDTSKNRRRRYWINPSFQGRYLVTILLLELLVAVVTALITLGLAFVLLNPAFNAGPSWTVTFWSFMGLIGVLGLALIWLGVRVSNRTCGPVYQMLRKLEAIRQNQDPGPIRLRDKDELKELAESINKTVEHLRSKP